MKKFYYTLLLILACNTLCAQLTVKSFRKLDMDMDARIAHYRTDQNGEKAALIKIVTSESGFDFDIGLMNVVAKKRKVGEVWLYVPHGTFKLTIKHPRLGVLRDYEIPMRIDAATTYELVLSSGKVTTNNSVQYFVLKYTPTNVDVEVFFDDDKVYIQGEKGVVSHKLKFGNYTYRIESLKHKTVIGEVEIGAEKKEINVKLVSTYGFADFTSQPSGAELYINNELIGTTPLFLHELKQGAYSYRMERPLHKTVANDFIVGSTKVCISDTLASFCGTIKFTTTPENGAEIYINDELAGETPFISKELEQGEYSIKVKSEYYLPYVQSVTVLPEGEQVDVTIPLLPNFAVVSVSADSESNIIINDQNRGTGEVKVRLISGLYTLEAQRNSHRSTKKTIEVVVGVDKEYTLPSPTPMYGTLDISSNVVDAQVYLDGVSLGTAPNMFRKQLVGTRSLEVKAEGYKNYKKNIIIDEAKTTNHQISLTRKVFATPKGGKTPDEPSYKPSYKPKATKKPSYRNKWRTLLMVGMGFSDMEETPYSVTFASYRKAGFYIRAESNFNTEGMDAFRIEDVSNPGVWSGMGGSSYYAGAFGLMINLYRNYMVVNLGGFYGKRYDYVNTSQGYAVIIPYEYSYSNGGRIADTNAVYGPEIGCVFGLSRFSLGFNYMYDHNYQSSQTNISVGLNF